MISSTKPSTGLAEQLIKQSENECTGCAACPSYCPEPGALLQY